LLVDFIEPFLNDFPLTLGSLYIMPDFQDLVDEFEFLQLITFPPSNNLGEATACRGLLTEK
jgi:hypothetical protein